MQQKCNIGEKGLFIAVSYSKQRHKLVCLQLVQGTYVSLVKCSPYSLSESPLDRVS